MDTRFPGVIAAFLFLASCQNPQPQRPTQNTHDRGEAPDLDHLISSGGVLDASVQQAGLTPVCGEGKMDAQGKCSSQENIVVNARQFACTTQKYRLSKVPHEFSALNPNADVLWPGALIQGRSVQNGILDPVPIKARASGSLVLTLATGGKGPFSETVPSPPWPPPRRRSTRS